MTMPIKVSAILIVKNEEAVISDCLSSLKGFPEVVVLDTGSEDSTVEIAKSFPNTKVYTDYKWEDDFAKARNTALARATGDWVMSIDADHVLVSSYADVELRCLRGQAAGRKVISIQLEHDPSLHRHHVGWLFKRDPAIFYVGRIHEHLTAPIDGGSDIKQKYRKSPSHALDPDRNMRILNLCEDSPRTRFYLAREYVDRLDWPRAVPALHRFLEIGDYLPEICDAHLALARGYWALQNGDLARKHCLEAVRNNPMFKEALQFMAELHYEPWKGKWSKLATVATNEDVLFIRVT